MNDAIPPADQTPEIPADPAPPKKKRGRVKGKAYPKYEPPVAPTSAEFPMPDLHNAVLKKKSRRGVRTRKTKSARMGVVVPDTIQDRDAAIYAEFIKGRYHSEIAKEVGLSRGRVTQICLEVAAKLEPMYIDHIKAIRVEHTDRLMYLVSEVIAEWHRSKNASISTTERTGEKSGTSTTVSGQTGNVSFIGEARAILSDIRKIWGADVPKKGPDGEDDTDGDPPRVAGKPLAVATQEWIDHWAKRLLPTVN